MGPHYLLEHLFPRSSAQSTRSSHATFLWVATPREAKKPARMGTQVMGLTVKLDLSRTGDLTWTRLNSSVPPMTQTWLARTTYPPFFVEKYLFLIGTRTWDLVPKIWTWIWDLDPKTWQHPWKSAPRSRAFSAVALTLWNWLCLAPCCVSCYG